MDGLWARPDLSDGYTLTLSKLVTFDISLRAVQKGAIYEQSLSEAGHKSPEQHAVRALGDLEFVNIIEDAIAQDYYCATPELKVEHLQKTAFLQAVAERGRSQFLGRFPHKG